MASSRVAKRRGRPGETVFEGRQYSDSRIAGMEAVFMEWQGATLMVALQPPSGTFLLAFVVLCAEGTFGVLLSTTVSTMFIVFHNVSLDSRRNETD
jgi:hypothetical protein